MPAIGLSWISRMRNLHGEIRSIRGRIAKLVVTLRYLSVLERGPTDLHNLIYELAPGTLKASSMITSRIRPVRTLFVFVFKSTCLNMGSAAWLPF